MKETEQYSPVRIGQTVLFDPFKGYRCYGSVELHVKTVGVVIYINYEHRWFSVQYDGDKRMSFNFNDVNDAQGTVRTMRHT